VELFADDSRLVRGLRRAQYKLRAFGTAVRGIGLRMMGLGVAMGVPLVLAGKQAMEFGKQMAFVATMLDEPRKHMQAFRQGLLEMSVAFGESTETLARGLYDILSASIAPSKALYVLEISAKAARAGLTDTAVAADAITTILNSYGMSADRAGDVSDALFQIVRRGKTTFAELAPQIGMVASTAATASVSVDELGAMISTLTRNGLRTENAITAINRVIATFLKPSDEAAKYADSLGFAMSTATLQAEGLLGVFQRISSLRPEDIAILFPNIRALRGVLPALKNMEGALKDLNLMQQKTGATQEAFSKITESFAFKWDQVKQSILSAAIAIGEPLLNALTPVAKWCTKVAAAIRAWASENKQIAITIAKVVGIIGGGGGLLILISSLVGVLAALLSPMSVLIGAGALLAGVLGYLGLKNTLLADSMKYSEKEIKDSAEEADKLIGRYEELAVKTNKTAAEELELHNITERLKKLFPEYAAIIDGTAGSLKHLRKETKLLGQAGKELALRKQRENLSALQDQRRRALERKALLEETLRPEPGYVEWTPEQVRKIELDLLKVRARIEELTGKIIHSKTSIRDLRIELGLLSKSQLGLPQAKPGEGPRGETKPPPAVDVPGAKSDFDALQDIADDWAYRTQQLRIQLMNDKYQREIALINSTYNKQIRALEKAGASERMINQANYARWLEIEGKKRDWAEQAAEERRSRQKQIAEENESWDSRIARERIRLNYDGFEEQKRLLALERDEAIKRAKEIGASVAKIKTFFQLRFKLLQQGFKAPEMAASIVGTFSAAALGGLGMGPDTQQMIGHLARIEEYERETAKHIKDVSRFAG